MNPTVKCVFKLKSKRLFAQKPTQIALLGIRIAENLSSIGFSHKNSTLCTVPSVPSWLLCRPCFNCDMYAFDKNSVSAEVLLENHFAETKNCFGKNVEIYTDGLKIGESVACAVICGNQIKSMQGNEMADNAAKEGIRSVISQSKIPTESFFPHISKLCMEEWQDSWDSTPTNKLFSIKPVLGKN